MSTQARQPRSFKRSRRRAFNAGVSNLRAESGGSAMMATMGAGAITCALGAGAGRCRGGGPGFRIQFASEAKPGEIGCRKRARD
jgi:hypothetical protein